jgi:hypothetical protein
MNSDIGYSSYGSAVQNTFNLWNILKSVSIIGFSYTYIITVILVDVQTFGIIPLTVIKKLFL